MSTTPDVIVTAAEDGTGTLVIDGREQQLREKDMPSTIGAALEKIVADVVKPAGQPVVITANDPTGSYRLRIDVAGTVTPVEDEPAPAPAVPASPAHVTAVSTPVSAPAPTSPVVPTAPAVAAVDSPPVAPEPASEAPAAPAATVAPAPAPLEAEAPQTRRQARQSFLTPEQIEEPATQGLRGVLARIGIRISPSEAERKEREWARLVSQHWPGPRTITVVNGKGGVGKTMTDIMLSAVFARYGGAGVLAWDNNQTRGTLGWRTEQGPHDATILDLLPEVDRLVGTGAQSADLAHFVHHQTRDRYDVLRSKPDLLASSQRFDEDTVDAIHRVAAKYYRLVFIDSGNDESDPMWLRAVEQTDQLVVATTTKDDHAEAGALLLEALSDRGGKYGQLASNAVVIVSQANPNADKHTLDRVAGNYGNLAREVATIPFDPALVDGILRYGQLRPATQRAWLAAAAAVAKGL